jgi:hypothetical protein
MNKWKKILLGIVIIIAAATACGYYLYNKKPADIRKETAQFELTATKLVEDFNKDETAANKKYLDKVIDVKGNIADIKTDTSGQATVFLESSDPMASVTCSFYADEAASVKALQKGSLVTIKGKCTGKLMDVVLNKCSVVK